MVLFYKVWQGFIIYIQMEMVFICRLYNRYGVGYISSFFHPIYGTIISKHPKKDSTLMVIVSPKRENVRKKQRKKNTDARSQGTHVDPNGIRAA